MSKGKIIRPQQTNLLNNQGKRSDLDLFYSILESCEVLVEDKSLSESYRNLSIEIKKVTTKLTDLEIKVSKKQVELIMVSKLNDRFNSLSNTIPEIQNRLRSFGSQLNYLNPLNEKIKDLEKINEQYLDSINSLNEEIKDVEKNNQQNLESINSLNEEITKLKKIKSVELKISINTNPVVKLTNQHKTFPKLVKILSTKLNAYVVGPAGSGKTTAAANCSKALGIDFYFTGAIASEYKLTGFMNAQGQIVSTDFRKAYEKGGLFLFDEIDASYPQAVLAFNAALANDFMDFPDGRINRHPDFYCIAAANTYGLGADRQYIGRNQLDAASLDRFVFVEWEFDEELELEMAGNDKWVKHVQKIRNVIEKLKIRHIVSPRASLFGAKLLKAGLEQSEVEELVLWKGMELATKNKIKSNL